MIRVVVVACLLLVGCGPPPQSVDLDGTTIFVRPLVIESDCVEIETYLHARIFETGEPSIAQLTIWNDAMTVKQEQRIAVGPLRLRWRVDEIGGEPGLVRLVVYASGEVEMVTWRATAC